MSVTHNSPCTYVCSIVIDATTYRNPGAGGKVYKLGPKQAVLLVRPRGWHLDEAHVTVNGAVISGSIFDFALYFFHNHHVLTAKGR